MAYFCNRALNGKGAAAREDVLPPTLLALENSSDDLVGVPIMDCPPPPPAPPPPPPPEALKI